MRASDWVDLLNKRGVDQRLVDLVREIAEFRALEPPTMETKQLLLAVEPDGYAAGRVGTSVLSLFFDHDEARKIADRQGLSFGQRSAATGIVRISAEDADDPSRRMLAVDLFNQALERAAQRGSWNRGLPDARRGQGDICPIHHVQRSLTGACEMCE